MKEKIELLAPAGDWDAFIAAVENGADAVYLGGKLLNARQYAGNFDIDVLEQALKYAHERGVKIYLTMNTLVLDSEMVAALKFIEQVYAIGIDGIIVQDLGFAGLLNELFPDLPLHASTQMTIYNTEGVKVLEKLGFKRVVLARELSVDEIKAIADNTEMELEVFIHGALCICYSGQCLMSSIIGGRSGNRGKCAQPCRLSYTIKSNSDNSVDSMKSASFLLSLKDLCSVEEQGALINAGVSSLKIEGRMKSPEYVAKVVEKYRKYIDLAYLYSNSGTGKYEIEDLDLKELTQIFNRGGFSKGYLRGKPGKDLICAEKPKNWGIYLGEVVSYNQALKTIKVKAEEELALGDGIEVWNGEDESPGTVVSEIKTDRNLTLKGKLVEIGYIKGNIKAGNRVYKTSDKLLNMKAKESYTGNYHRKLKIDGTINIRKDEPVSFKVADKSGNKFEVSGGIIPEKAINKALTVERVEEQLRKTGATPFDFNHLDIFIDEGLALPLSELNNLRRIALEGLAAVQVNKYYRKLPENYTEKKDKMLYFPGNNRKKARKVKISAHFQTLIPGLDISELDIERVYLPFRTLINEISEDYINILKRKGIEIFAWLPAVTRGNYDIILKANIERLINKGIDGLSAGNTGHLWLLEKYPDFKLSCESSMNPFNSYSLRELNKMGIENITLSTELNLFQISNLYVPENTSKEAITYGRVCVMTSEYCPVGSFYGDFSISGKCTKPCENGSFSLKDRKGMEFPVYCDKLDCRSSVFNSNVIFTLDALNKITGSGIDYIRLDFTDEKASDVMEILQAYRDVALNGMEKIHNYDKLINRIKSKGFTKGHFFRGV